MKKSPVVFVVVAICALMAACALAGCGGSSSSASTTSASASASSAATASSSASASAAASAASASAASSTAVGASSASGDRGSASPLISIDGVDVNKIAIEMVGDTPNLQFVFANKTNNDVELDLSPFRVLKDDKDEVNFHLTKKTVKANTPYLQLAETASPGSMKVGDSATIYHGDTLLGTFEVGEF